MWPATADGDVFRRLERKGFDFSRPVTVDFQMDFAVWPPDDSLLGALQAAFPSGRIKTYEETVQLSLQSLLTYEFVIDMQRRLTAIAADYGGICEAWGVLQPAPG